MGRLQAQLRRFGVGRGKTYIGLHDVIAAARPNFDRADPLAAPQFFTCAVALSTMLFKLTTARSRRDLYRRLGPGAMASLSRCLSGPALRSIVTNGRADVLRGTFVESGLASCIGESTTLLDALVIVFELLRDNYRCDYLFRTAIGKSLFLGRHSPSTTAMLSELRVWRSKVDLAMFNGTSVAYEIKSDLDNLGRLDAQLRDYTKIFDEVFVVVSEDKLDAVRGAVRDHVGLMVLRPNLSLSKIRAATSNAEHVCIASIVDALRKDEVVAVTKMVTGSVPTATPVQLIDRCAKALANRMPREVHAAMVTVLKRRQTLSRKDFESVRPELVSAYLDTGLEPRTWSEITRTLTRTTIDALVANNGNIFPVPPSEET